jgi:hypothetical protein
LTPRPYPPCLPRIPLAPYHLLHTLSTRASISILSPLLPSPEPPSVEGRHEGRGAGDRLMGTGMARALPLALALLLACSDVAVVAAQGTERIQGTRSELPSFSCCPPRSGYWIMRCLRPAVVDLGNPCSSSR